MSRTVYTNKQRDMRRTRQTRTLEKIQITEGSKKTYVMDNDGQESM